MANTIYLKKLVSRLLVFSFVITVISATVFYFLFKEYFDSIYVLLLAFNLFITYFVLKTLFNTYNKAPKRFNNTYLLFLPIKFIVYIIIFIIYILVNRENAIPFTVVFMLLYFLYSGFEVKEILQFSKIK
jgi:F0F1-type ATP synthase assembly protein I